KSVEPNEPEPVCTDHMYPRYRPGNYEARCIAARTYRDPQFQRWICRLEFRLVPDGQTVFAFLNLGHGEKPYVGRPSEYRRAWILANGDVPRRRQAMSHRVCQDKIFLVRIGDTTKRFDGREHPEAEIYSKVREILKRTWP